MIYSIDTSALLDGWIRHYPRDTFDSLWERLGDLISQSDLRATEEVRFELEKKTDDLLAWTDERQELFVPIDEDAQLIVSAILSAFPKLVDTRTNRSAADPFVIALAVIENCTVVTGEVSTGNPDRPNIPDVRREWDIECINLLTLIRREGWRF